NQSESESTSESTDAAFGSESVLFTSTSSESSVTAPEEWNPPVVDVVMDDQRILLPCKLSEIKNIAVDLGLTFSVKERDNGGYMTTAEFLYNGEKAGTIYLDGDCSAAENLSDAVVIGIIAENVPVSYKGLTLGSSKEEVIRELGDPEEEGGGYIYYRIEPEGSVTFSLDTENKVTNVAVFPDIR
ncbi:MAG: hypothetical protein HDT43_05865, partial [Ruminococcaceae bacterium]|nr:hypothetical protein [Oscillospiraceae bacterium]